ncbi:tryptophan 2-C-methyltransferase [Amycolatopsis sacchari]|uniref:Tryptophan 2-C-methyltransferase n=1 Tax=Amycolatopsis sacchari TaxID=115433 RepID=A0A1I3UXW2_9PSEU|nr:tryptophan 2-C-methyltransferase [Amycolatopsis sacchari]SFJ88048.1 tryptophan 2-C-methyltransferase [Amycolatopsis sacchari]
MGKSLVTLVNPNLVHPPITPYALDILTTSLEMDGFDVEVVDLTFRRDDWRSVLREYFAGREPLLVGVTVRNTDTIYAQQQRVFLSDHHAIISEIKALTSAPVVAGGVGFSSMPFALTDWFGIPFGVKGPGENTLVRLANALLTGAPPETVPGLIVNRGGGEVVRVPQIAPGRRGKPEFTPLNAVTKYTRRSGDPYKVDNLRYYRGGGLGNILTKNGCTYSCAHCVEPDAKGTHFTRRAVEAVVDEMELLCAQGVYDLHTTDSEFNLAIAHSKAVLREVIRRREDPASPLRHLRLWIYAQPTPFDEELLELLVEAGCAGVNLAPDHVSEDLLDDWKVTGRGRRYYDFADVRRVVELTKRHDLPVMVEVLLGMPGETVETMTEAVRETLALDVTVAGYSLGIRAFPYSPLGIQLAQQCDGRRTVPGLQSDTATEPIVLKPRSRCASVVEYERQFVFDRHGRFRPVYYLSPLLPEDPETLASPNGRWEKTVRLLWDLVPESELHRVMLPTLPGLTEDDNNYADNPFLLKLIQLGYTGAFWSHWPKRAEIMQTV